MKVGDELCLGSLPLDTMVHPDYRGQGMFTTLAKEAYKLAAERGIHFIYGFPNENSRHGFITKLDWRELHNGIPLWVRPLNFEDIFKKRFAANKFIASLAGKAGKLVIGLFYWSPRHMPSCCVSEVSSLDGRFDLLWQEASKDYNILAVRDKAYLAWRYIEKPGENYTVLAAERGEKLLGFIVVKCAEELGLRIGFIMDMLSIPEEAPVARDLLSAAVDYFELKQMDIAGCLMLPSLAYSRNLRERGFIKAPKRLLPQDMYLGVCDFTSRYPMTFLADPGN